MQIEPALWNKLKAAFTTAFTDTAKVQNAYYKLMNYYQCNDNIDTYISTFRHLAKNAGYLPDAAATIDIFLKHLDQRLLTKILNQETEPNNMARWEKAAQIEYKQAYKKAVMLQLQKYEWNPPLLWWNGKGRSWHPDEDPWPYVPMDIDKPSFTFISHAYTEEDKAPYQKKGDASIATNKGTWQENVLLTSNNQGNPKSLHSERNPTRHSTRSQPSRGL